MHTWSHIPYKYRSFSRCPFAAKKLNLTQQKQTFTSTPKDTTVHNTKHKIKENDSQIKSPGMLSELEMDSAIPTALGTARGRILDYIYYILTG